ncbi:small integral membrane protein 11 isoform X1 [Meles meles]|uniref:small integral membrane protein 11 isoform X1 n=1 Tax=Meles meles TaxID=9662 RepID=UPI001E69D24B|nr:small integral membrane protein 11 isoform X1 [Meles meles]
MRASAFPKVNARMLSEDMNATSGNFWGAKDPQSQTAGDARAPALRPPPPPAQANSEPPPGQPHPPGPIVTLDPCAVSQRPAHSGSLRRRAQLSTIEKQPGLTAPARSAVHFGTCSFPAALWELRFLCNPGAGTSAAWSSLRYQLSPVRDSAADGP